MKNSQTKYIKFSNLILLTFTVQNQLRTSEALKEKHNQEMNVLKNELNQLIEEIKDKNQNINEMCGLIVNNKALITELKQKIGFYFEIKFNISLNFFKFFFL